MDLAEEAKQAAFERTDFYENPDNRQNVMTIYEDSYLRNQRYQIDQNFHRPIDDIKRILRENNFNIKNYSSIRSEFLHIFEYWKDKGLRIIENKNIRLLIKKYDENLLKDWSLSINLGAKLRILERKLSNDRWYKRKFGKKFLEIDYRRNLINDCKDKYLKSRKIVFKELRRILRSKKFDYKVVPLNPKDKFIINNNELMKLI